MAWTPRARKMARRVAKLTAAATRLRSARGRALEEWARGGSVFARIYYAGVAEILDVRLGMVERRVLDAQRELDEALIAGDRAARARGRP